MATCTATTPEQEARPDPAARDSVRRGMRWQPRVESTMCESTWQGSSSGTVITSSCASFCSGGGRDVGPLSLLRLFFSDCHLTLDTYFRREGECIDLPLFQIADLVFGLYQLPTSTFHMNEQHSLCQPI